MLDTDLQFDPVALSTSVLNRQPETSMLPGNLPIIACIIIPLDRNSLQLYLTCLLKVLNPLDKHCTPQVTLSEEESSSGNLNLSLNLGLGTPSSPTIKKHQISGEPKLMVFHILPLYSLGYVYINLHYCSPGLFPHIKDVKILQRMVVLTYIVNKRQKQIILKIVLLAIRMLCIM